jgi:hypothetical protein
VDNGRLDAKDACSKPSCGDQVRVLSRFQLIEHAWDHEYENRSNIVDSYVRFLREKIDRPFGIKSIETVRGVRVSAAPGRPKSLSNQPASYRNPLRLRPSMSRPF